MAEEVKLDSDTIQEHYKNLLEGADACVEAYERVNDEETNIEVKFDMTTGYGSSLLVEQDVSNCLVRDASNLESIGQTFFTVDSNLASDIDDMLTYTEEKDG